MALTDDEIVSRVRADASLPANSGGPSDKLIVAGVRGFVEQFDYWYIRFLEEKAIPQYRSNIVARINPYIRRIDCDGMTAQETADRIVEIYSERNFVTAGGWALEAMANRGSASAQKSPAEGIDLQTYDGVADSYSLYVMKSGPITRNSDIINALKRNSRDAQGRLGQTHGKGSVTANYATAFGTLNTTTKDGVRRPSSAQFWREVLAPDLSEDQVIDLTLAMVATAAEIMRHSEGSKHLSALKLLVATYIADPASPDQVDWEFIAKRNMRAKAEWKDEDKARHIKATKVLQASGYKAAAVAADSGEVED